MKTVLYICVHNAGRSKMSEAFTNQLATVSEDWGLDDPKNATIEQVRVIRDQIRTKVETLLSQLAASEAGIKPC